MVEQGGRFTVKLAFHRRTAPGNGPDRRRWRDPIASELKASSFRVPLALQPLLSQRLIPAASCRNQLTHGDGPAQTLRKLGSHVVNP
jgi:hypothetical protein